MAIVLQGNSNILPSALIVDNLICFPIVRSLAMRGELHATEKRIRIREEEKEEIKEAEIAARNDPRMVVVVEVVVNEKMIIQIMATAALRLWVTSGCAFTSASPVVGIPLILMDSIWLGRKTRKRLLSLIHMNFASKLELMELTLVSPPSLTRHSSLEE